MPLGAPICSPPGEVSIREPNDGREAKYIESHNDTFATNLKAVSWSVVFYIHFHLSLNWFIGLLVYCLYSLFFVCLSNILSEVNTKEI